MAWLGTHRGLVGFLAGVLVTLLALAAVGYLVLADQRRSARLLAAALSRALAREVRIDRMTELAPSRLVMQGVHLPPGAGWPAEVRAERVETTGPLLAAVRGEAAPLRVVVTRPTVTLPSVTLPAGAPGTAGLAIEPFREALAGFLAGSLRLDVSLSGGHVRKDGATVEFDLVLQKGAGEGNGELVLKSARGQPLVLSVAARLDGQTAHLRLEGRGGLAPLAPWLPDTGGPALADRTATAVLAAEVGPGERAGLKGRVALADLIEVEGEASLQTGVLTVAVPRATVDLVVASAAAELDWRPAGRATLTDVTSSWRPGSGALPVVHATLQMPSLALPAVGGASGLAADRLEARLALEPADDGAALSGEGRADRVRVAGVEVAPVAVRWRVRLGSGGRVAVAALEQVRATLDGVRVEGSASYDGATGRLDGQLGAADADLAGLFRRHLPGWLGDGEQLRVRGLRLGATGLDPARLEAGSVRLEAAAMRWVLGEGELAGDRVMARAELGPGRVAVAVDARRLAASVPALAGLEASLAATVDLTREAAGGLRPARGLLTARDGEGRILLTGHLAPGAAPGRLAVTAEAPALERLDGLWPDVPRRLRGSARLDVKLGGQGDGMDVGAIDGRLAVKLPEAELLGGQVALRDLTADLPFRRGPLAASPPAWGTLEVGELIGYGVVVRDLTTPARVVGDRLSLNDLACALYSGAGKGWAELELVAEGLTARGQFQGERVRIEEFMSSYGIRGGTMTGLLRYDTSFEYRGGRLGIKGVLDVPQGGSVSIELLNRLLAYAQSDPTGIVRRALENLRGFNYRSAHAEVRSAVDDIRVSLSLLGRERILGLPAPVREINIRNMPLGFLARQFPGS